MEGQTGLCGARKNENGAMVLGNYGKVTSWGLDPIEKKPLRRFYPGSMILSVGSYGCNLSCPFCQNHEISMAGEQEAQYKNLMPEELVKEALRLRGEGNIGIAYTYNEPMIGFEYVRDCASAANKKGLKNVVVTNGCVEEEILLEVLPFIDAFNIDLKSISKDFYEKIGGDLDMVKHFIKIAASHSHVEVTTLVIPGENDSLEEIEQAAAFLSSIDSKIPYHISRFFPNYRMSHIPPTETEAIYRLALAARKELSYVYTGNC